jgi:uncharacterized integral membrane protein
MKVLKIINWAIRIGLFIIILVLVLDNMQTIDFSIFTVYHLKMPLIALLLIFFALGSILGFLVGFFKRLGLNAEIRKLKKQIEQTQHKTIT